MPTSPAHAGVSYNKRVLQQLDMAVVTIPEIETVLGKAGRTDSALDPAPLSMYENIILYKSEYILNKDGKPQRFRVDENGLFMLKNGGVAQHINQDHNTAAIADQKRVNAKDLIPDNDGELYRNWRPHIKTPDDIWKEIIKVTKLPGVTSAPKLQPIETRLVMLQTGMRASMGIKIKGRSLKEIEAFGLELEELLKDVDGVNKVSVFADRMVSKPYAIIDIDRDKLVRYGISVDDVQQVLKVALGGMTLTQTIDGRARYGIRVRYPRELRTHPEDIKKIYVQVSKEASVPLSELATIRYEKGPQVIKSEDAFLTGHVLFDKLDHYAAVDVVENAKNTILKNINEGRLKIPSGISYQFSGTYEHQLRSEKSLSFILPVTLLVIFLILYIQFKSIITSIIIFIGVAVAFGGGCIMLWLYGQDWFLNIDIFGIHLRSLFRMDTIHLSVAVWVGFIALFGIATDDGVLMATYLTQSFENKKPKTLQQVREAVIAAGQKRIRPCLITTATLITLFVVPILFSWRQEYLIRNIIKHIHE